MPRVLRSLTAVLLLSDSLMPAVALAKRNTPAICQTAECLDPLQKAKADAGKAFAEGKSLVEAVPATLLSDLGKKANKADLDGFHFVLDSAKKLQKTLLPKKPSLPAEERAKYLESIKDISNGLGLDQDGRLSAEAVYLPPIDPQNNPNPAPSTPLTPEETRKMLEESLQKTQASAAKVGRRSSELSDRLRNNRSLESLENTNGQLPWNTRAAMNSSDNLNLPAAQRRQGFRTFSSEPARLETAVQNIPPKKEEKGYLDRYKQAVSGHMDYWDKKARAAGDSGTAHVIAAMKPDASIWSKAYHYTAAAGNAVTEGVYDLAALNKQTWKQAATGAAIGVGATLLVVAAVPSAAAAIGLTTTATVKAGIGGLALGVVKAGSVASATYFVPTSLRDLAAQPSVGNAAMAGVSVLPVPGTSQIANALKSTGAAKWLVAQAGAVGSAKGMTAVYKYATQEAIKDGTHTILHQSAHLGAGTATGSH